MSYNENIAKTLIANLKKRGMEGYYCETGKEALDLVLSMIPEGSTVSNGGSQTLVQTGILEALQNGPYEYLDRKAGETPEENRLMQGRIAICDYYLMSTNAITLDGQLVNIDGHGNRLAYLLYGPENVIVVTSLSKLVQDEESGYKRVRTLAAPPNTTRLGKKTPCSVTGKCGECFGADCICCQFVTTRQCNPAGRIKVVLVGETYGY